MFKKAIGYAILGLLVPFRAANYVTHPSALVAEVEGRGVVCYFLGHRVKKTYYRLYCSRGYCGYAQEWL